MGLDIINFNSIKKIMRRVSYWEAPADYIIFKDGDLVMAKNGKTGVIEYVGTNVKTILSKILQDETANSIYIKDGVDLPLVDLNPAKKINLEQGIDLQGLGYTPSITDPTSLTFNLKKVYDIANKLQPMQLLYENNFNGRTFNYVFGLKSGSTTLNIANGKLEYSNASPGSSAIVITDYKIKHPSIVLVVKIESVSSDNGRTRLGISDLSYSNYLIARYFDTNAAEHQNVLTFEVAKEGTHHTIASTSLSLSFPVYMMMAITGRSVSFFYSSDGENWVHVLDADFSSDFKLQEEIVLNMFYPVIGIDSTTATIDFIKIYHVLPIGIADMNPITYEDGNPIIINNKVYFSCTLRGIGSRAFQSYTAICSLDLTTYDVELISVLYSKEYVSSISGYGIFYDHATHVMYDRLTKTFRVFFSAWDDSITRNRVCVKIGNTKEDLLQPGVYIIPITSDTYSLNATIGRHYDPFAWYDYDTKKYYIEICNRANDDNIPTLIETTDFQNFEVVTQATQTGSEGGNLFKIGGEQYIIAENHKVYSKDDLTYLGALNISEDLGSSPWGFIIPKYENGKSRYLYVVFNHNDNMYGMEYSYGRVYIYESDETEDGYPYWITKKSSLS